MYIPVQLSIHVRVHVPVQPAAPPPPMRMSTAVATHPSYPIQAYYRCRCLVASYRYRSSSYSCTRRFTLPVQQSYLGQYYGS